MPGTFAVPGNNPIKKGIKAGPVVDGNVDTAFLNVPRSITYFLMFERVPSSTKFLNILYGEPSTRMKIKRVKEFASGILLCVTLSAPG